MPVHCWRQQNMPVLLIVASAGEVPVLLELLERDQKCLSNWAQSGVREENDINETKKAASVVRRL